MGLCNSLRHCPLCTRLLVGCWTTSRTQLIYDNQKRGGSSQLFPMFSSNNLTYTPHTYTHSQCEDRGWKVVNPHNELQSGSPREGRGGWGWGDTNWNSVDLLFFLLKHHSLIYYVIMCYKLLYLKWAEMSKKRYIYQFHWFLFIINYVLLCYYIHRHIFLCY